MILTVPYHDPDGRFNAVFEQRLDDLYAAFEGICLSITPQTEASNGDFVHYLQERGCRIMSHPSGSTIGDHLRGAMRLAVRYAHDGQAILYGFLDRLLFALDTEWRDPCLQDLRTYQDRACVIFDRSPSAWDSHPANYREMEEMVSRAGEWLYGEYLELGLCALLLSRASADVIAQQSVSPLVAALGEWILIAMANDIPITTVKVDWLAWEDPFWEGIAPHVLKEQREHSPQETRKRITMMSPFMLLMTEERFQDLHPRIERIE
jgi:hypothetical protein